MYRVGSNYRTSRIGGFDTIAVTRAELAEIMASDCLAARQAESPVPRLVFSSNGQGLALASQSQDFEAAMTAADIVHADGMPVVLASRLLGGVRLPERISTTDFFHDAARVAVRDNLRFFVLGGEESENERVVEAMKSLYPGLEICGRQHGYFSEGDEAAICERIVASGTDVLWVGLGKPKQEFWSVRNREQLRGVGWVKTCGGLYSFLTGDAPRAGCNLLALSGCIERSSSQSA